MHAMLSTGARRPSVAHARTITRPLTGKVGQATTAGRMGEVCVCVRARARAHAGMDVHVCVRVCMYHVIMHVCTCARMYLCMYVLMHECTYVHNPNPHAHSPAHRNRHHLSHLPSRHRPVRDCVRVCQAHVCVRARVRVRVRVSGGCPRVRMCAPRPCVSHRSLGCRWTDSYSSTYCRYGCACVRASAYVLLYVLVHVCTCARLSHARGR